MNRSRLLSIYNRLYKKFGPQKWWPGDTSFEVIIGAILTQNTSWSNVEKAIKNLKKEKLLTPEALSRAKNSRIAELIRPSGYYNIKTQRVRNFLNFLNREYSGNLKKMLGENPQALRNRLLDIKGIGPETADSILLYAANRPFFVIDAYTKRIFFRHNFVKTGASYEELQKIFMENLPRSARLYNEYHALIVKTGRELCRKSPKCRICPIKTVRGIPSK